MGRGVARQVLAIGTALAVTGAAFWLGMEMGGENLPASGAASGRSAALERTLPENQSIAAVPSASGSPFGPVNSPVQYPDLRGKFDALATSGLPADALAAYKLAYDCLWARAVGVDPRPAAQKELPDHRVGMACANLTDEQLASRTQLLTRAAEAGVPSAAVWLMGEGPPGDRDSLYATPRSSEVLQWKAEMKGVLERASLKGDYVAMSSLATFYAQGDGVVGERDPVKALEYATAMWEVHRHVTGRISKMAARDLASFEKGLSAEQVMAARAAGVNLAARATDGSKK